MEILRLNDTNLAGCAARGAAALRAGGIVLYPTDTLYGLGADAFSDGAVAKIFDIKDRRDDKPIHAIVSDLAMAREYGDIPEAANVLVETFGGKVTLIVRKREFDTGIVRGLTTFGFRIPDNDLCKAMLAAFGKPITATSANKSGAPTGRRIDAILAQLGEAAEKIDLVIDAGELPERMPSSVVDLSGAQPRVLREGAISTVDIFATLAI